MNPTSNVLAVGFFLYLRMYLPPFAADGWSLDLGEIFDVENGVFEPH